MQSLVQPTWVERLRLWGLQRSLLRLRGNALAKGGLERAGDVAGGPDLGRVRRELFREGREVSHLLRHLDDAGTDEGEEGGARVEEGNEGEATLLIVGATMNQAGQEEAAQKAHPRPGRQG